jgi:hypothetical protein
LSDVDQAKVSESRTKALATYVQGGVEALVPPQDYLERILGLPAEEAEAIIEAAMAQTEPLLSQPEEPQPTELEDEGTIGAKQ